MKAKCSICKAKSKDKRNYKGKLLCPECHYEYLAIFEGWQSNKNRKAFARIRQINKSFNSFLDEKWEVL